MNRRSFLRFLGVAPVAAPAIAAAAQAPIDYSGLTADVGKQLDQAFNFDAASGTLKVPSVQIQHQALRGGKLTLRASADNALAEHIDVVIRAAT